MILFSIFSAPLPLPLWNTSRILKFSGLFPILPSFSFLIWKNSPFVREPLLPTQLFCGRNFPATYMKHLASDILKVFREVLELNLFKALSLGLFTNVNFILRDFRQVSYEHNLTLFGTEGSIAIRFYETITLPTATCQHQIFISGNITWSYEPTLSKEHGMESSKSLRTFFGTIPKRSP